MPCTVPLEKRKELLTDLLNKMMRANEDIEAWNEPAIFTQEDVNLISDLIEEC